MKRVPSGDGSDSTSSQRSQGPRPRTTRECPACAGTGNDPTQAGMMPCSYCTDGKVDEDRYDTVRLQSMSAETPTVGRPAGGGRHE